jgi:hypothetical protein
MPRPKFTVQPQRSDGRGYVPCEVHRATSWAVIRTEQFRRKGKLYTASRVVDRFSTKTLAEGFAHSSNQRFEPLGLYKLGKRIPKKGT